MLTGVTIRNFRGFRDVAVDGFSRVNIVVGDNGSGKTSLLEAIFLGLSNTALMSAQLRALRVGPMLPGTVDFLSELLSENAADLAIEMRGDAPFARRLTARFESARVSVPTAPQSATLELGLTRLSPIGLPTSNLLRSSGVFRWEGDGGRFAESTLQPGAAQFAGVSGDLGAIGAQYLPAVQFVPVGLAQLFSDLDKDGSSFLFLDAMRAQFSDLDVIAVQLDGGQSFLYAKFKAQRQQRPLEYLSGGLTRLSTYLLCLSARDMFVFLADEVENGLHHSRQPLMWRQIRDFAVRFNKQVFATTHSQECLEAAADAMAEAPEDFALVRTARVADGIKIGLVSGEPVRNLLRSGLEVRG